MIKPMLAFKFDPKRITYPCFLQPKLNGVRGIYIPKDTREGKQTRSHVEAYFQSRYGEIWNPSVIEHAFMPLTSINVHLDGEFYSHGMSLQEINSRVAVVRGKPHEYVRQVKFHIFDVIVDMPFYQRAVVLDKLKKMFADNPAIDVVETVEVSSSIEADYYYSLWRGQGYEGAMYRAACATYGFAQRCGNKENRWHYIWKRKGTQDMEAMVIGLKEEIDQGGEPKGRLGAFELRGPTGCIFTAGSGLTAQQRAYYWTEGDKMLGTNVRITFEMYSDGGKPLKPIVECVNYV